MESQNQLVPSTNYQTQLQKQSSSLVSYCYNKEESNLVQAISNQPYVTEKDFMVNLVDVLAQWRWMSGVSVSNQDDDDVARELALIAQFVRKNYPKLTLDEIRLCIDLSLTDKLDCDVRTFNTFSPMYVSRILNAYQQYRMELYQEISNRKKKDDDRRNLDRQPSTEEKMEAMKELIVYFYEKYKAEGIINDYFNTLYEFFKKNGFLNVDKSMVDKALEYGRNMASKDVLDIMSQMSVLDKSGKPDKKILERRYARNYCIQEYFEATSLEVILSKINVNQFA